MTNDLNWDRYGRTDYYDLVLFSFLLFYLVKVCFCLKLLMGLFYKLTV